MKFSLKFLFALCTVMSTAGCGSDDTSDEPAAISSMRFAQASYLLSEGQTVTAELYLRPLSGAEFRYDAAGDLFDVTFSIADPTIASVSPNGSVTALKKGSTTLTARSPYCATEAGAQIVVSEGVETLRIESLRFEQREYTVEAGRSVQLRLLARLKGENTEFAYDLSTNPYQISLTSSDKAVATVSAAGLVQALAAGTATLTARTPYFDGTATAALQVTASGAVGELAGEWMLASWTGDPALAGKVYLALAADKSFTIYQNVNTLGYAKFTGTYSMSAAGGAQVISGTYTGGTSWGDSYTFTATADRLTMTGRTTGYVSVYDRTTIPDHVKDGATVRSTRSAPVPFL